MDLRGNAVAAHVVVIGLCVAAASLAACSREPVSVEREGESRELTLTAPVGNVEAGRKAFLDLRCTACHAVPAEPTFPRPVSANPGPPIDARVAGRDVSYLATAIVSPSHTFSLETPREVREHLTGVLSPMGDFSHSMTVRQLVDLHAYLRSVK
jgi:hypothetical protein